jgi:hypothetical protein
MNCTTVGDIPTLQYLECIFGNAISYLLVIAGFVFLAMLISGGFKYLTSGGDPKAVAGAQTTLTYAVFGMLVAILAYLMLVLIQTLTGANVTNFVIYKT